MNHFEKYPFDTDVAKFIAFIEGIIPGGGGDLPEDVIGGLSSAVDLKWPESSGTRVIYHLGICCLLSFLCFSL